MIMEPKFDEYMLPILKVMSDMEQRKNSEIRSAILKFMNLKEENFSLRQKNGNLKYIDIINFAISYLFMAGLLIRKATGIYEISQQGLAIAKDESIKSVDEKYLKTISPAFKERMESHVKKEKGKEDSELTPLELIEANENIIKETVKAKLLASLTEMNPYAFERVCLKLLQAMGYGEYGDVTKKSGDGGIDGIIYGDKLALDKIAYQSKRWDGNVGRKEVSKFVTDFSVAKCSKGVFFTTSKYTKDALDLANSVKDLVLIDGDRLTDLMYEYKVGVQVKSIVEVKDIDGDFFEELD